MKAGDEVMLVWACCPHGRKNIGWVGPLQEVAIAVDGRMYCCDFVVSDGTPIGGITVQVFGYVPLSWLKKMPAPGELDEMPAPPQEVTA